MSIDVALFGTFMREPERKTSAAGRPYLRFNVRVGSGDGAQFANVMVFNDIDELARTLAKDGKLYVEGTLSVDTWIDRDGKARPSLTVMAWRCVETHQIGRNRLKREQKSRANGGAAIRAAARPEFNDEIEF